VRGVQSGADKYHAQAIDLDHYWWRLTNVTVTSYIGLALIVIWSLGLLFFVVDAAGVKFVGLCFLGVGLIVSMLHRPLGWLMFNISRLFHMDYQSWGGQGQQGAQSWYLGIGLVLIGVGCIYLIRSII
jgi:hypothetical protein